MWNRKGLALVCVAAALALRIHWNMQGRANDDLFLLPLFVISMAFLLPVALPVVLVERYAFHFEPWADGHGSMTALVVMLAAALLWFFPVARVKRWFGTFEESIRVRRHRRLRLPKWLRLPSVARGAAYVLDAVNKRLFGIMIARNHQRSNFTSGQRKMWRSLFLLLFTASLAFGQTAPNAIGFSAAVAQESLPALVVQNASQQSAFPHLEAGDVILTADRQFVSSPIDLQKPQFCRSGGLIMRLDVYRPAQNSYFEDNMVSSGHCPELQTSVMFVTRPVLKVTYVAPQSTAYQYGLQPGDILLAYGKGLLVGSPQEMSVKADQLGTLIATTPDQLLSFNRMGRIYVQKFHVASEASVSVAGREQNTTALPAPSASQLPTAQLPQAPAVNSQVSPPPSNPIVFIQEFLRSKERTPTLPVSGNWDAQTAEGVRGFLAFIQSRPMWGHPWNGPRDGAYSDTYAYYLRQAIRATQGDRRIDQADVVPLESFAKALDDLKAQGIYKEPQSVSTNASAPASTDVLPGAPPVASAQSHADPPFFFPAFLWFANGALSGFGDEMWCGLMHSPQTFSQCHADARTQLDQLMASDHLVALGANFAGVAVNPISWILIGLAVWSEVSVPFAVLLAMLFGVADCALYTLGDLFTWGFHGLDFPQILANTVTSALIFLLVVAKHRWDDEKKWHDADRHRHRHR